MTSTTEESKIEKSFTKFIKKIHEFFAENYLYIVFFISLCSVIGSLYFSNVQGLEPCVLCWYQRIFLYPLLPLSTIALMFKETLSKKLIAALTVPGMLLAMYHYGVQKFGIGKEFLSCGTGAKCDAIDFQLLGFITIPFLSFCAFFTVNVVLLLASKKVMRRLI